MIHNLEHLPKTAIGLLLYPPLQQVHVVPQSFLGMRDCCQLSEPQQTHFLGTLHFHHASYCDNALALFYAMYASW